jgi:hypothetical protein
MTENPTPTLVYEYTITSAEMRSLDQNLRKVMLLVDENGTPLLRGEVPDCGAECFANLSEVILEFIMSCEGCVDPQTLDRNLATFSTKLSKAIAIRTTGKTPQAQLKSSLDSIFSSMDGEYSIPDQLTDGTFGFNECPICAASKRLGIQRGLKRAHRAFYELCRLTIDSTSENVSLFPIEDGFQTGHSLMFRLNQEA